MANGKLLNFMDVFSFFDYDRSFLSSLQEGSQQSQQPHLLGRKRNGGRMYGSALHEVLRTLSLNALESDGLGERCWVDEIG
jgi:hypothetical protein